MTVILGAANAYLGLRAGVTIAATYPAAVISMAVLRGWKGSLLEENIERRQPGGHPPQAASAGGKWVISQGGGLLPAWRWQGVVLRF
jgi:uncharacterized oligopeptide transporter (OPT) family protein